ncbi:ABC transporter permease [Erysipelotrichaceae bacterium]|nr:ABC transporter permease [Erysipelotrichaceae bacterium]
MKKKIEPYLFLAPHLLLFVLFILLPLCMTIYTSFTQWDMLSMPRFNGFDNYYKLLFDSESVFYADFRIAMWNTFRFVLISVPLLVIFPLGIATLLNYKPIGHGLLLSIFYIPGFFSVATVGLIWKWMLDPQLGTINKIFGLSFQWTTVQPFVWIAIIIMTLWWTIGANLIIFLAGIAGIPQELYESAEIDGAREGTKFWKITLPLLKPQMLYIVITTTIASFNLYGQPLVFSNGGPNKSSSTFAMFIQGYAFGKGTSVAGIASAMGILMGLMVMCVALVQLYTMRKSEKEEGK